MRPKISSCDDRWRHRSAKSEKKISRKNFGKTIDEILFVRREKCASPSNSRETDQSEESSNVLCSSLAFRVRVRPMTSETNSSKRTRRSRQDPQFVFESPTPDETETKKRAPKKTSRPAETTDNDGELYEPGDIVWCKLGNFPWWPALIVS